MALSTTLKTQPEGEPVTAKTLKAFLSITHDDTPIMIKIGDTYHNIREIRQVTDSAVSGSVLKVLVPVDFTLVTK
jgi:predicted TIM-barrel enzyme